MNVVFVVLDTVRKDKLSIYNEEVEFTENLDSFGEDAVVFEDAVSQAPWTLPSHASMFTGMYPWEHEATQKNLYLETEKDTLAEVLKAKGYSTACYTTNTWISSYTGMTKGFEDEANFLNYLPDRLGSNRLKDVWKRLNKRRLRVLMNKVMDLGEFLYRGGTNESSSPNIIDKSSKFVEREKDNDFFLFVNFMDAHLPHSPPKEYMDRHSVDRDPEDICQRSDMLNAEIEDSYLETLEALYDADIDYLDDQLEDFFDIFRSNDLMDETLFVIVSDHGENIGGNGKFGHQFSVSENLVSVPLMIKSPFLDDQLIKKQFETRELYNLIPELVEKRELNIEEPVDAFGGYEYPELDLKNIPEEKQKEFGEKLRFIRSAEESKKIIQRGQKFDMIDLDSGEEIEIDEAYREKIERIGEASEGEKIEQKDEKVKKRLEDLGYI